MIKIINREVPRTARNKRIYINNGDTSIINSGGGSSGGIDTSNFVKLTTTDSSQTVNSSLNIGTGINLISNGVINWGSAANQGSLTWDSGKAIISANGGNSLELTGTGELKYNGNTVYNSSNLSPFTHTNASDWNAIGSNNTTMWTATNGPSGGTTFGGLNISPSNASYQFQIAGRADLYYLRSKSAGTQFPWRRIWHDGNLNKSDVDFTARQLSINGVANTWDTAPIISFSDTFNNTGVRNWSLGAIAAGDYGDFAISNSDAAYGLPRTTRLLINRNGNVGIGTTSPNEKLELYNSTAAQTGVQFGNLNTGSSPADGFFVGINTAGNAYMWQRENLPLIFGTNSTERMRIDASGNLTTPDFSSSTNFLGANGAGWAILKSSNTLEIDNIIVRKSLRASEFILNKIRASNGSIWVTDSCKVKSGIHTYNGKKYIYFEDHQVFTQYDIIKAQSWSTGGIYNYEFMVLETGTDSTAAYAYIYNLDGTVPTITDDLKGKEFVRIGNKFTAGRQGALYLTASDSNNPYLEVYDGLNSFTITNAQRKVRVGKLDGITTTTGKALSGYGFYSEGNGYIGGWDITNNGLIKDTGTASTSAGIAPVDYPFYAGSTYSNRASAPFRVAANGNVVMVNATLQTNNSSGRRIVINSTDSSMKLYTDNANSYISIDADAGSNPNPKLTVVDGYYYSKCDTRNILLEHQTYNKKFSVNTGGSNLTMYMIGLPRQDTIDTNGNNWKYLKVHGTTGQVAYQG